MKEFWSLPLAIKVLMNLRQSSAPLSPGLLRARHIYPLLTINLGHSMAPGRSLATHPIHAEF